VSTELAQQLINAVTATLPKDSIPAESDVSDMANRMRLVFPIDDVEFDDAMRLLQERLHIVMAVGTYLVGREHVPWLSARKARIDPYYWQRHRDWLLKEGRPPQVVHTLDQVTDDVLDLMGDPTVTAPWSRRGLVMGDVQSGKTGTYTALTSKAADAGYRLIILLTGSLENLRRQTQERMDEGFVGFDSSGKLTAKVVQHRVGVGMIDARRAAGVFTSRTRDFNRQLLEQLGFRLDAFSEPVIVVMKKNRNILENIENWLRALNAGADGKIAPPMLMIDDEADSASINTAASEHDPSTINRSLRRLLQLFHHSSYVGFTATPFANIFIDPETDGAMLGDDLFPRDFIYTLETPSNYLGPVAVFGEDDSITRTVLDAEPTLGGLKSGSSVEALPESLMRALRSFLVVNAIRDLRAQSATHRSMLVNVSAYTNVQSQVATLLGLALEEIQREVRLYARLDPSEALPSTEVQALRDEWASEHNDGSYEWGEVQHALHDAVQPVQVREVNQRTGAASLDYRIHSEHGLRVVAVGGNSLSRGLTLEGLSTSYFYRNSQMYDTLLQMGRWFGYRDGYGDLCRIWLTEEAEGWYTHITRASEELREELKRMRRLNMTPKDFGLKVRGHPDSLIVTARNKMRSAKEIVREVSLDGRGLETDRLNADPARIEANRAVTERWLKGLPGPDMGEVRPAFWSRLPGSLIADLLDDFQAHPLSYDFQPRALAGFIRSGRLPVLEEWDVVVPEGSGDEVSFGGRPTKPSKRNVLVTRAIDSVLISGRKARIGSRGVEKFGLTAEQVKEAEASAGTTTNVADRNYREVRERPLLLIYPVLGHERLGPDKTPPFPADRSIIVGLGLSFPHFDDSSIRSHATYKVNLVEWRSMFDRDLFDGEFGDDRAYDNDTA
jgi:Z1 domain